MRWDAADCHRAGNAPCHVISFELRRCLSTANSRMLGSKLWEQCALRLAFQLGMPQTGLSTRSTSKLSTRLHSY